MATSKETWRREGSLPEISKNFSRQIRPKDHSPDPCLTGGMRTLSSSWGEWSLVRNHPIGRSCNWCSKAWTISGQTTFSSTGNIRNARREGMGLSVFVWMYAFIYIHTSVLPHGRKRFCKRGCWGQRWPGLVTWHGDNKFMVRVCFSTPP